MVGKTNVSYRKNFSSECTAEPSTTCAKTTKKTAPIWQTVLILPKMLGRKSRKPTVAYSTIHVATISTSRPSTATVYFQGIFLVNASTRKSELNSNLSAMGSRY